MKRTDALALPAALLLALGFAGCESQRRIPAPTETSVRPEIAQAPTAVLPDGFEVRLEFATNNELRGQGLMYRESLPRGEGMLFIFPEPGEYPFWMKNTLIPLDMIWLDSGGKIVAIRPDSPPCRADPCPTYAPDAVSSLVLELAAGEAKAHGLSVGDVIRLPELPPADPR